MRGVASPGADLSRFCRIILGDSKVIQHNKTPNKALGDFFSSLVDREGEKVAKIFMLIHNTSGLPREFQSCNDFDHVLKIARRIVSSLGGDEAGSQAVVPFNEDMYASLEQNDSERVAKISREIYNACALSSNVDYDELASCAYLVISPYGGIESEAQADNEIGFPGYNLMED